MANVPVVNSTALNVVGNHFPPAVIQRVGEITSMMCTSTRNQIVNYEGVFDGMQAELEKVQGERRGFADRVHELELELEGMRAAQGVMQTTLQRVEKENGQLTVGLGEQTTAHHRVRADLEIALREKQQTQTILANQNTQLETALRRLTVKERFAAKVEERRTLEAELKKVQEELDTKQSGILNTIALACGVVLSLLTSWVLGLVVALGGRKLVSGLMADNVNCPCTTPLYARQASLQGQLSLVNEEIERLKSMC